MQRNRRRGLLLVLAGALLVGLSFGSAWALAPDRTVTPGETEREDETADLTAQPILVGVQGPGPRGYVTMIDADGSIQWNYGNGTDGYAISYQNVQRLDDGRILTTFADDGYEDCGPFEPPCKRTGVRVLAPASDDGDGGAAASNAETVAEWQDAQVDEEWSYAMRTRKDSEVHDAELLPSGDVLVADMEYESIFVVDVETGERGWTWNASEYYEAPADPTREDWLHINDVDAIDEDRYLVSVRNENQLVVVERGEGVVEVINEDGDPDVLYEQHNPQWLGDGRVLVADSENDRVVELHREEDGEWVVAWEVTGAGGLTLDWPRDADRLPNGNTVVTDSGNDRVLVVDERGTLVRSYATPALPYEADVLQYGEQPGWVPGEPSAGGADAGTFADDVVPTQVPLLTTLLAGARHVVPVPYWVSELHVLAVAAALALWGRGGQLLLRGRRE